MWRLLLILAPVIVYFAVDWSKFAQEPVKPLIIESPIDGVYEYKEYSGSLSEVLQEIGTDLSAREKLVRLELRYPMDAELLKTISETLEQSGWQKQSISFPPN